MNAGQVKAGLQELKRSFRSMLAPGAEHVIDSAIAGLEESRRRFDERTRQTHHPGLRPEPWGYRIYPGMPLVFKQSEAIRELRLWVDLYGTVLWAQEGAMPACQVIHVRVWDSSDYVFRPEWDSEDICDRLTHPERRRDGRVMLRCHFDLANPSQLGPRYHLQVGGRAQGDEFCWFPETIALPRLAYPPVDLLLICQLIAANFYWEDYQEFRDDPAWKGRLRASQEHLLRDYYGSCVTAIDGGQSVLDALWNPRPQGTE